jgi:hypothetical protein
MIDVSDVVRELPHFESFCSVARLHALVASLRGDPQFEIESIGKSANGMDIHHVRRGEGAVKALFVAGPHAMEPIGGLTVFSLLSLLRQGNPALCSADVEWHIVPCIDPDGAILNEGWSLQPFTLERFMKNYYVQPADQQVDVSFPIAHKNLVFDRPSHEAKVLQALLDRVRPDFFFSLHNAFVGGGFYHINRNIDPKYYRQLRELLQEQHMPLQTKPIWSEICPSFAPGVVEMFTMNKYYDRLEQTLPNPELMLKNTGASSWEYLARIKPEALSFVAEFGYASHPDDDSKEETGQCLRQFKLRIDADSKFLVTQVVEEWDKVESEVDRSSPFYAARVEGLNGAKDRLLEGGVGRYPTRDLLFRAEYSRPMTKADRLQACLVDAGLEVLCTHYQFVRLLKASRQTRTVRQAVERLERAFDVAFADVIANHIDIQALQPFDCDTLARVQLGSGIIALNSVLEARA